MIAVKICAAHVMWGSEDFSFGSQCPSAGCLECVPGLTSPLAESGPDDEKPDGNRMGQRQRHG
jgi:hypothetical protein